MKYFGSMTNVIFYCIALLLKGQCCWCQCSKEEYKRCTLLADPLLKDPHLIYPDNLADIDHVCRSWSQFVDCVKRYTDLCFTETKRKEFNKAIESPIDLVHEMCTLHDYQKEYLKHARCMRAVLTEDVHCGRHYRQLVSQVSGEPATPALCCSHHRFRECVLDQTSRSCEPEATIFAKQILDRALSFLRDQCATYQPDQIDCPGSDFYSGGGISRITSKWVEPTRISSVDPHWSRAEPTRVPSIDPHWNTNMEDRRSTGRRTDWSASDWSPSSSSSDMHLSSDPQNSGSSTRATYSRGMNWESTTADQGSDISWRVSGGFTGGLPTDSSIWSSLSKAATTTTTLNPFNNAADEPNQQGLSNQNTASSLPTINAIFIIIISVATIFFKNIFLNV